MSFSILNTRLKKILFSKFDRYYQNSTMKKYLSHVR